MTDTQRPDDGLTKVAFYWTMTLVLLAEGFVWLMGARWASDVTWWQRALWVLFTLADCAGALTIGTLLVKRPKASPQEAGESRD